MRLYESAFVALVSSCGFLSWWHYSKTKEKSPEMTALKSDTVLPWARAEAAKFTRLFLAVYCLVMASDWLQGPYVYSLYRDQFGLNERTVALLFTTGFLSGGVSGFFVGQFADKCGRKKACLLFCITYSVACVTTLVPRLPALFFGRIFGGISSSLMYSAFESWLVTEYHQRQLSQAGLSLSSMFGTMTTLNSVVAIMSGVSSEWLVHKTHTKRAPFMASAILLSLAFWIILGFWSENYGDSHDEDEIIPESNGRPKTALRTIFADRRILSLGLASCCFEGSMYLFVFFWTPALKAVHQLHHSASLPLGTIFASFMASVMFGSLLFNIIVSSYQLITHSRLLIIVFATASSAILMPVLYKSETVTFASFCIFEACVGMYWPSVGYLKGRYIDDGMRARIYGLLRIPLNIFVVVALGLTKEGHGYRDMVFLVCSGLLVFASGVFNYAVSE